MTLESIDQYVLTPDEGVVPPEQLPPSTAQRLRIHVPNVKTTLSLGATAPGGAVREADTGAPNFAGFGVDTEGHVFVNARGGKEDSKMSLQANGQVLVQSDEDSLYLISAAPSVIATPMVVNVAGGGGVNIAAGWGTSVSNPSCDGGAGPTSPGAVAGLPDHLSMISNVWAGVDSTFAALAIAGSTIQAKFANPADKWTAGLWGFGNVSAAACIGNNALGFAGMNPADGGVTIHGTAGWLVGTPLFGSLYAGAGLTIASTFPAMMALVDGSIMAGRAVGLAAGKDITLTARNMVSILGGKKVEIASRGTDGTAIKGQKIVVGSKAGPGQQMATDEVAVNGKTVAIAAKRKLTITGTDRVSLRGKELVLAGDQASLNGSTKASIQGKEVGIWGDDNVALGTSGFSLNVGTSSLTLGNTKKPLPPVPTYEPPTLAERLECLASDTPHTALRRLVTDAEEAYDKKVMSWLDKVGELQHKNCSIELKDGDIKLEVHGFKFRIDSTKTAISNTLKISQ